MCVYVYRTSRFIFHWQKEKESRKGSRSRKVKILFWLFGFLLFLIQSLVKDRQGTMLRRLLYSSSIKFVDKKFNKINTGLQENLYINCSWDTAHRNRTKNRVREIAYLNKSIFQERRRWTELCWSYGCIKTVWFNKAIKKTKIQLSLIILSSSQNIALPKKVHFQDHYMSHLHHDYI